MKYVVLAFAITTLSFNCLVNANEELKILLTLDEVSELLGAPDHKSQVENGVTSYKWVMYSKRLAMASTSGLGNVTDGSNIIPSHLPEIVDEKCEVSIETDEESNIYSLSATGLGCSKLIQSTKYRILKGRVAS